MHAIVESTPAHDCSHAHTLKLLKFQYIVSLEFNRCLSKCCKHSISMKQKRTLLAHGRERGIEYIYLLCTRILTVACWCFTASKVTMSIIHSCFSGIKSACTSAQTSQTRLMECLCVIHNAMCAIIIWGFSIATRMLG